MLVYRVATLAIPDTYYIYGRFKIKKGKNSGGGYPVAKLVNYYRMTRGSDFSFLE
jgi:hypothetical protein